MIIEQRKLNTEMANFCLHRSYASMFQEILLGSQKLEAMS